ncbi:Plasma membrane iron permease [Lachnellula occidentalis]|uniref:Plasma membrane iron permease n=1 Tax=Lachnellula occidentalis TaxID=215460 RepID=A0A8H8RQI5_9HELO|nr:Plasma membrane iron permease [Lachnellula occidentalis]
MTVNVFAVPVFFVVFRETLETAVIVSVLLAFLKQTLDGPNRDRAVYKKLVKQVWYGTIGGLVCCLIIGGGLIGAFYGLGKDRWASTEYYWEGSFAIFASVVISILGAALLRVSKMQEKWRVKLAKALETQKVTTGGRRGALKRWAEKYCMFMLPFITVLREGLEAVVFIAGVSFSSPASAVPLPVVIGLIAGFAAGWLLYKGGATSKLQYFLILSTCLLYLVAAGLLSRAVWYFEAQDWNNITGGDAAETGSGAGSYDIRRSVWHVNFGNPELNGGGGWGIFNAILGWQNSATYGSVISYNIYWIAIITGFFVMRYKETTGHLPLLKAKKINASSDASSPSDSVIVRQDSVSKDPEKNVVAVALPTRTISE